MFTKREIIELFDKAKVDDTSEAVNYILTKLNLKVEDVMHTEKYNQLRTAVQNLKSKFTEKWKASNRTQIRFQEKNSVWLESEFEIPNFPRLNNLEIFDEKFSMSKTGRPNLPFDNKSKRSKRRDIAAISNQNKNDPQKILMACRHAARLSGEKDLFVVLNLIQDTPERARKIRKLLEDSQSNNIIKLTPEKALSFLLDRSLSKEDYISMRLLVKGQGADIFPHYHSVREAKFLCRPPVAAISVTENKAKVSLQALLDHTGKRIFDMQKEVLLQYIQRILDPAEKELETIFICSYGFDGSTGHSPYKQRYQDTDPNISNTDENLFATSLIPLRWSTKDNVILWNNRASQSTRFCRPISLQYVKESADIIATQKASIEAEIDKLQVLEVNLNNIHVRIHFSLFLTLIDGKVLNIITNTKSTQTCPICHATPKQFNDLSNKSTSTFIPDPKSLHYGVSPLHAWIRFFECCLHISYRLDIKIWQVRTKEQKIKYSQKKLLVQEILHKRLGLNVDKPKPGGCGNTNDGNTARRAFENVDLLAECLGLNNQLLRNFRTILIALSCHLPIDPVLFENLCYSTAEIYVSHYVWFPMPSTVHKILIHAADIMRNSLLPIGMLGEEASEARNKNYKQYRCYHSRKHNRTANLTDVFNRIMDTSDPIISSLSLDSRIQKKKQLPLPEEIRNLLAIPTQNTPSTSNMEHNEDEYDFTGLTQTYKSLDEIELSDAEEISDDN